MEGFPSRLFMKMIKLLLQGAVIGLANIIPGVSGGTMMVAMGIYDRLIRSITHLFTRFRRSIRFLLPILVGAALAILLLSRFFTWALDRWNIPTSFFFIGLILGSFPLLMRTMKVRKPTSLMWLLFAIFFIVVIGGAFFSEDSAQASYMLDGSLTGILLLFIVGIIAAATMVIPGISGSMILMILGYYRPILYTISALIDALKGFSILEFLRIALLLVPFGLGVVIGIFLVARLVEFLLKKYRKETSAAIWGLLLASPISILLQANWTGVTFLQLVASILLCVVGMAASFALSRLK